MVVVMVVYERKLPVMALEAASPRIFNTVQLWR
jgi:hypothetical protein